MLLVVYRAVSFRVKKRFPDLQHLVDAGLMREDEYKVLVNLDGKVHANKWFLPLVWASDICARALAEQKVRPQTIKCLIGELCNIREKVMEMCVVAVTCRLVLCSAPSVPQPVVQSRRRPLLGPSPG